MQFDIKAIHKEIENAENYFDVPNTFRIMLIPDKIVANPFRIIKTKSESKNA